jgi:hypothetical protein
VSRPSPRAIDAGSVKRTSALPSASVVTGTRPISASSTVTTPVRVWPANGSPVARLTWTAAATVSPGP